MIACDINSRDLIKSNPFIINEEVSSKVRGLMTCPDKVNYPNKDTEVLYYNYIPKERLFFLEPLQVDMLYNDMLDSKYFEENEEIRRYIYQNISDMLWERLEVYPRMYQFIYDNLYVKRLSIEEVNRLYGTDPLIILSTKEKILEVLNEMDMEDLLVKKTNNKIKVIEK